MFWGGLLSHNVRVPARGSQYGSFLLMAAFLVGGVVVLLGSAAALGAESVGTVVAGAVGMLILTVALRSISVVTVDRNGVSLRFPGGGLSIPWSDIKAIEGHLLSGRIVRASSGKRVFFSMLDPYWRSRPVTQAIQHHLVNHPWVTEKT
jgi:hypothetical protein